MRRSHSDSRFAVRLRHLRSRFGIAAPQVMVRSQLPWPLKAATLGVALAIAFALAGWIYDAGRKLAGIDPQEHELAISKLRDRVAELEAVGHELQTAANVAEARVQFEQSAQESLRKQVLTIETENARLKEDLAVFENMSQGEEAEGSTQLSRLRVEPALASGVFQYRLLATYQSGKKAIDFKGKLQLHLTVQQAGKNVMMILPKAGEASEQFSVSIRRFRRVAGTFRIPEDAKLLSVEARLIQDGNTRATTRVSL